MPENLPIVDVVTKISNRSVDETVARFVEIISTRALKLFAIIDQGREARAVGLRLRETVLVVFSDPRVGTQVMESSPLAALDLPLKVLVWSDGEVTRVSYESANTLTSRHHLKADLAKKLSEINALTDALVAPL